MPADVPLPPIYLLGSIGYSAQLAAHVGAGFSFAHHFSDFDPVEAMLIYREQFKPSATLRQALRDPRRRTSVCADTDAEAERLATTVDLNFVRRAKGEYLPLASPGGSRGLRLFADRPRADRAEPRQARRSAAPATVHGAARAADRGDQGRRTDGHHR